MARLPGSVMTSNYQMGRKHGKIWKNIEKHGVLPVPVHRNRGILRSLFRTAGVPGYSVVRKAASNKSSRQCLSLKPMRFTHKKNTGTVTFQSY